MSLKDRPTKTPRPPPGLREEEFEALKKALKGAGIKMQGITWTADGITCGVVFPDDPSGHPHLLVLRRREW